MERKFILVTGGAGLVGSHLCERLVSMGHQVVSLDNYFAGSRENHVPGVEYREGHTKDIESLVPETPHLVYHLGEYSRVEKSFEDIGTVWDLNKLGTFAVLEFVRKRGSKLVYAGSSTKFADGGMGKDQSPYAWAKATNSELVRNYGDWFGIKYAITYFYNVYGPRERSGAFGTLIEIYKQNYLSGRPLTVVAPGTQRRNFTHVLDIVEGLIVVGEKGEGDDYGLGDERSYSVAEVAEMFGGEILMLPERQGNRTASGLDTVKARVLGWSAKRSLQEYVAEIKKMPPATHAGQDRVLVFSTAFHPIEGPAERALCALMKALPNVHFDVVTAALSKHSKDALCPAENATVHRVGWGTGFDKYLLPILGARKASKLMQQHRYLFSWALMASYAGFAALFTRRASSVPLLVTLADQKMTWYAKFLLPRFMRGADQVYASESNKDSLPKRMSAQKSLGTGDAFANQVRFAYEGFLREQLKK